MNVVIMGMFQILDMAVYVLCAVILVHAIPESVESARWKRILAWIGYTALAVLLPRLFWNDLLTWLVLTFYFVVIGRLLYYRSKMGIICQVVYLIVAFGMQYMAVYLVTGIYVRYQVEQQTVLYLNWILRALFLIVGTVILREMIVRRFKDSPYLKIRGMIIVPVFSMLMFFLYVVSSEVFLIRYGYYWILIFCILLLAVNLYCLYFWYDVAKNRELRHKLELMQQQKELTVQYYEDMEANYNNSRKVIHDIRNHLHAIEQKYRIEEREYIDDVHAMLNSLGMKFYTENKMLNIVLNDKLKGIPPAQIDCNLGGIGLEFITDIDITTIFANLLDNAVDAGKGVLDYRIQIRGEEIQDFTVVKISNPLLDSYVEGKSTKPGHEGIGLQNVRQALEKYQAEMDIQTKDNVFSVTLLFARKQ